MAAAEPSRSMWWQAAHTLAIVLSFTTAVMALLLGVDLNRSVEFQRAVLGLAVATLGMLLLYALYEMVKQWRRARKEPQ